MEVVAGAPKVQTQTPWNRLAARARWMRRAKLAAMYGFLIAVSVPLLLPYFWMV